MGGVNPVLEKHERELRESEREKTVAIWNLAFAGATLAALVFKLDDKIGIGIGLTVIILWNLAILFDRRRRLQVAFEHDKAGIGRSPSN